LRETLCERALYTALMAVSPPYALGLAILASGALAISCGEAELTTTPETPAANQGQPNSAYAGLTELPRPEDRVCASCHAREAAKWRLHGMANALGPLDNKSHGLFLPSPWLQNPQSGFAYQVREGKSAGQVEMAQERPAPAEGLPTHQRALLSDFRIGAGVADLSLVLREGDAWRFAPLEFFRHHGWAPAPQELGPGPPGFGHGITKDCLVCHSPDRPPAAYPADALGDFVPKAIGCATCHGDGKEHVALMRSGEFVADTKILHPADLPSLRQVDLCARCHLEGDARIDLGGGLSLPAPGSKLLDGRAVVVGREAKDDLRFVSQVRRLALSDCFTESPAMSCTTCHDAHLPPRLEGRSAMVQRCLSCHDGIGSHGSTGWQPSLAEGKTADCIDCHMPARRPLDLLNVSIQDHWIRVVPEAPAPLSPMRFLESASGDWVPFAYPQEPGLEEAEQQAVLALARAALLPNANHLQELQNLPQHRPLPQEAKVRGILEAQLEQFTAAEASLREALEQPGHQAEVMEQLATVLIARGDEAALAEAAELANQLEQEFPAAPGPWRLRFLLAAKADDFAAAESALLASLDRDDTQAILWQKLGRLQRQQGQEEKAVASLMRAYAINPDLPGLPQDLMPSR
jgi:hypothetical protein